MKTGDWIALVTAIGVTVTAIFTFCSFLTTRRQDRLSKPALQHIVSASNRHSHPLVQLAIRPPDNKRFSIEKIKVKRPRGARISATKQERDEVGGTRDIETGEWSRALTFKQHRLSQVSWFIDAPAGASISLAVNVSFNSDPKVTTRLMHHISMAD